MVEKEAVIENVDKATIRRTLKKIKAKNLFSGKQVDMVFDFKKGQKLWDSKPRSCVRVRTEGKEVIVTFWSEMSSSSFVKQRGHHEFTTNNLPEVLGLLNGIGMVQIFPSKSKIIERYQKGDVLFELKSIKRKTDLEIEASSRDKILKAKRLLGL